MPSNPLGEAEQATSDVPLNLVNPVHLMAQKTFLTPVDVNLLYILIGFTPSGEVALGICVLRPATLAR